MNCESARTHLLTHGAAPPAVGRHLLACPACRALADEVAGLDAAVAARPAEPGSGAKEAFLATLLAPEPLIVPRPRRAEGPSPWSRVPWVPLSGLAAGALLALGLFGERRPPAGPAVVARAARYELLQREVQHLVRLSGSRKPAEKMEAWSLLSDDLRKEVAALQLVAPADELRHLQTLYAKSVEQGLVPLAAGWNPVGQRRERKQAIDRAEERLARAEAEAAALAKDAPAHARPALEGIAAAAKSARGRLRQLGEPEGVPS